jgi:hypothetical protein
MHTGRLMTLWAGWARGDYFLYPCGNRNGGFPRWVVTGPKWVTDALAGGLHTRPETPVWKPASRELLVRSSRTASQTAPRAQVSASPRTQPDE